jgi:hypothetical protein
METFQEGQWRRQCTSRTSLLLCHSRGNLGAISKGLTRYCFNPPTIHRINDTAKPVHWALEPKTTVTLGLLPCQMSRFIALFRDFSSQHLRASAPAAARGVCAKICLARTDLVSVRVQPTSAGPKMLKFASHHVMGPGSRAPCGTGATRARPAGWLVTISTCLLFCWIAAPGVAQVGPMALECLSACSRAPRCAAGACWLSPRECAQLE